MIRIQIPKKLDDEIVPSIAANNSHERASKWQVWHSFCFLFASALAFAAPHLALWNSNVLSTGPEHSVWKTGSIAIISFPAIVGLMFAIRTSLKRKIESQEHEKAHPKPESTMQYGSTIVGLVFGMIMCAYAIIRLGILVEMFYSLHSSPKGIYKDVKWSQFWPHL